LSLHDAVGQALWAIGGCVTQQVIDAIVVMILENLMFGNVE